MDIIKKIVLSPKLWSSVIVIVLAVAIWLLLKKSVNKLFGKNNKKKGTNSKFFLNIIKYLILLFAIVTVLQINGYNVSSLVTGLGVAGIIVGFALQDLLKDLIMGFNIVWDGYFSVGDFVSYGEVKIGEVVSFTLKSTKIYDVDTGNTLVVSNRNIAEITRISNWLDVVIKFPYGKSHTEIEGVAKKITEKVTESDGVDKCKQLGIDVFADSSVDYKLRVFCNPALKPTVKRKVNGLITETFDECGISIPFNQLDVHIDK